MKIDPSARRSPPPSTRGPGFFDVGVVRSAPESYRDRYRRTASVRSSRVRSVLPGWRPVLGLRASFLARRRSHPFSSGLTLLDSVSRRSCRSPPPPAPQHRPLLVVGVAQAGKVSVRDSLRDAVTDCTTSPRRSSCVAYPASGECERAIPRLLLPIHPEDRRAREARDGRIDPQRSRILRARRRPGRGGSGM